MRKSLVMVITSSTLRRSCLFKCLYKHFHDSHGLREFESFSAQFYMFVFHLMIRATTFPALSNIHDILHLITTAGFACFTYIVGFFLLASSAIYVSPLFCGTNNEMKTIRAPLEVNGGGKFAPALTEC